MGNITLKPCFNCGEKRVVLVEDSYQDCVSTSTQYGYFCRCEDCGLTIFCGDTEEAAAACWNRLADLMAILDRHIDERLRETGGKVFPCPHCGESDIRSFSFKDTADGGVRFKCKCGAWSHKLKGHEAEEALYQWSRASLCLSNGKTEEAAPYLKRMNKAFERARKRADREAEHE